MTCILNGKLYLAGIDEYNFVFLETHNIGTIINVAKECTGCDNYPGCRKYYFPYDDDFIDIHDELEKIIQLIHDEMKYGAVLVHCRAGMSRSATFVVAYIMKYQNLNLIDAFRFVHSLRPIKPNPSFMKSLMKFELELFGSNSFIDQFDNYSVDYIMMCLDAPSGVFLKIRQRFIDKSRDARETVNSLFADPLFTML